MMPIAPLLLSALLAAVPPAAVEILLDGAYHADGPWAEADGEWLALVADDDGFELVRTQVNVLRVESIMGGQGYEVETTETREVIVLIRGLSGLELGPVPAAFYGWKSLDPGELLALELPSENTWTLLAFGCVEPAIHNLRYRDYRVVLGQGTRRGEVFSFPEFYGEGMPTLRWVGDLDADGVPDILAEIDTGGVGAHHALFLSSAAEEGEIVTQVASLRVPGC